MPAVPIPIFHLPIIKLAYRIPSPLCFISQIIVQCICQVKIPGIATLLHSHEGVSQVVTWAVKCNQVAMVGQAVNPGNRHLVIGKNGTPFGKLQVGIND